MSNGWKREVITVVNWTSEQDNLVISNRFVNQMTGSCCHYSKSQHVLTVMKLNTVLLRFSLYALRLSHWPVPL